MIPPVPANAVSLLAVVLCAVLGYWILGPLGLLLGLVVGLLLAGFVR